MAKTGGISPEKILEVAEVIISLKGIKNTSLNDIAKAATISKGTLYYYYASKESLIYDLASRHFDRISKKMTKWIEDIKGKVNPEDLLRIVLENSIEELQFDKIHLYLIQEIITGNEELKENFVIRYKEWEDIFTKALIEIYGENTFVSTDGGTMLLSLLEGLTIRKLVLNEPIDYKVLANRLSKIYT